MPNLSGISKSIFFKSLCFMLIVSLVGSTSAWAGASQKHTAKILSDAERADLDHEISKYPPLKIGPGDQLTINVVNHSSATYSQIQQGELSGSGQIPTAYTVNSDGKIFFPFVGVVQLKGLNEIETAQLLMKKLAHYIKFPQVTVLISNSNHYNISVLGEVFHPGKFLIRGEPTLISMLSEAGGPLQDANLGGAILIHNDKKSSINLNNYLTDKNFQNKEPLLYPGDVLMVPKDPLPTLAEWGIIASILSSAALIAINIK